MRRNLLTDNILSALAALAPAQRVFAAAEHAAELPVIRPLMELRAAADPGEYELLIYGDIGDSWWGESVSAQSIVEQLAALDDSVAQINVRINSYGGSVSDGLAIYNVLRRHGAKKIGTVDGVAMSSASLIAMACDELNMPAASLLMIHAPWGLAQGNANDMRIMADVLDTYAQAMASSYMQKSGMSKDAVLGLLTDGQDHYYTGEQAVEAGFADAVIEEPDEEQEPDPTTAAAQPRPRGLDRFIARAPAQLAAMAIAAARRKPHASASRGANLADSATRGENNMFRKTKKGLVSLPPKARATTIENGQGDGGQGGGGGGAGDVVPTANEIRAAVTAALRDRNAAIQAALKPLLATAGIRDLYEQALADPAMTIDQVNAKALALAGAGAEPAAGRGHIEAGATAREKFRTGVEQAILARAGHVKADMQNEFRSHTLLEIARAAVEASGKSTGRMTKGEIVGAAFTSTSDFPNLLANIANKSLLKGWSEAGETFPDFTNEGVLTDFKPAKRVDLNEFSSFAQIPEGGEYQMGQIGDRGESIQLAKYGRKFAITREAIINDDLSAFTRIPMKMGTASKRTIGNLVFAVLTGNPAMADTFTLFDATHHLNVAATPGGILTASVDTMRVAMAKQTDPNKNAVALNIKLARLIVPVALGGSARVVRDSQYQVDAITSAKGSQNTTPNSVRGIFEVTEDARLDAVSATAWYGCADSKLFDTIEVAYLDGQNTPYLEQRDGWDVDGTEMKVRIEAGVKALDFRSLQYNAGA